ncbi:MAG: branched-chain amino acid transport system substrate-binding protein [Granulosicoccus sp.]
MSKTTKDEEKFMKKMLSLSTLAMAAVFTVGTVQAADEIVIGATLAKTGRYATSARTTETAIDIAVAEINTAGGINGKQIRLVKFDTNGDPKQAQVAVRSFAEDEGALAVIGPFSSGEARVAFAAGERLGIVQIPNASSAPELADKFSYAYRVTESEFLQFNRLVGTMKAKGMDIADTSIMYVSDEFVSKAVGTMLMPAVFGIHKVDIVGEPLGFPTAAFDLSPQVAQLMEKPTDTVAVAGIVEAVVKTAKELRRQGHTGRIIGSGISADPDLAKKVGADGDGMLYATWFWWDRDDSTREFTTKFNAENAKRGIEKAGPHHVDASAYDIVYILKAAMEAAGVTGDDDKLKTERTAIRDTLSTLVHQGISGTICFDKNGDAELPAYIVEIMDGGISLVDSHPAKECS